MNWAVASIASTLFVLVLALPAAYALSIRPVKKWTDVLFFFLSTKMLPVVASLLPIYLFAKNTDMLDNIWLLVILYTSMNLRDRGLDDAVLPGRGPGRDHRGGPGGRREAAHDPGPGGGPHRPPGHRRDLTDLLHLQLERTALARVLTGVVAETAPVFLTGFITSQGLFLAKVCAASLVISLPVLAAGFAAQDELVQGLSLGAVK
ncbi:Carbohydrate ABC transporter permease OS=Streptomyces tendae OX=1932 GN=GUR47_13070 PE=3 SV=1 [Streptomyces tendae]